MKETVDNSIGSFLAISSSSTDLAPTSSSAAMNVLFFVPTMDDHKGLEIAFGALLLEIEMLVFVL